MLLKFKNNKFNLVTKAGFTLVELIVSVSIIIVIVSLTVINYNAGFSETNLSNTQNSLYQNIKQIQSYALSYRSYNNILPKYWGMYLATSSSVPVVFADINENGLYDDGEADTLFGGKEIVLEPDIIINNIKSQNSSTVSDLYIMFESGGGDMYVYNSTSSDPNNVDQWFIELRDIRFPLGKLLILNNPGLTDTKNCSCNGSTDWCCSFCTSTTTCSNY
ncbi:MAG TPA: hypothetical protein PLE28_01660 [bacterium]|nr:hypothetical protein [bacterium]